MIGSGSTVKKLLLFLRRRLSFAPGHVTVSPKSFSILTNQRLFTASMKTLLRHAISHPLQQTDPALRKCHDLAAQMKSPTAFCLHGDLIEHPVTVNYLEEE